MTKPTNLKHFNAFVRLIEDIAAWFLFAVMALTFVSVILRYVFSWAIPDTFDMTSHLLAILIFWGFAGTGYRGEHITVDLFYGLVGPKTQRVLDIFSNLMITLAMVVLAVMVYSKVMSTKADNVLTFDLHQPVWIYYLIAWLGLVATSLLMLVRMYFLFVNPNLLQDAVTSEESN